MSTITLPNIRVSSDLTVKVRLKDSGVAIDWSTLTKIKASIYSDAQRALAGRCDVSIDAEDSTLLVCNYAANKPQYLGVNRIVISAKYMGETKTYDKPAFSFVRWTADQEGEEITIDDPDVDVEIDVEDISSSILQEAVDAAFSAADRANEAAAAAEHMVDIHTGPEGKSAYEVAVEEGYTGTEEEWLASLVGPQGAQGIQGETGEAAGFGSVSAALQEDGGDPSVVVAASGEDTSKNFAFTFKNLKGDKGDKGDQGNTGSSVDYPYELVNNLTTNDATKGLSAAQGVVLAGQVSQLQQKLYSKESVDLSLYSKKNIYPSGASYTSTTGSTRAKFIPVNPGEIFMISTVNATRYCVLNTYSSPASGDPVDYATGYSGNVALGANESVLITIPSNGHYLCVFTNITTTTTYVAVDSAVWVTDNVDDLQADMDTTKPMVAALYGELTQPKTTVQRSDYYIKNDGTLVNTASYKITTPIAIKKGQKVTIHSYMAAEGCGLALTDSTGSTYTPVITSGGTAGVKTKSYVATEDCYVAWSYTTSWVYELFLSAGVDVYEIYEFMQDTGNSLELVDEVYGKSTTLNPGIHINSAHIQADGSVYSPATGYVICDPVAVKKGQKISINSYIPKGGCGLALTDANSTSYTPVISNTGKIGKVLSREYVATQDCYVAWSYTTYQTHEMKISAAVNMSQMYEIYTNIAPNVKTGINDLNPFLEFQEKFIAAKKKTNNVSPLVLLAFSDIHGSASDNLPRILEFADTHSARIDEIVNLGDMVSNQFSNPFPFESIEGSGAVLNVIGNHDTADYSGGVYDWTAHTGLDAYNRYIAPFVENWDVTQPEGAAANGYCYYYKDYTTQGIRIVFLDVMGYDATQEAWLESILADAKTNGLSVLIAAHYPPAKMVGFDGKYSLIEENLMNRPSYNANYYTAINVVESFVSGGGELIGWIVGHRHADIIGKLDGTSQLCLIIDTAQFGSNSASPEYDKIDGTKTQDAFSAISIDTQAKTLSTFKVGCRRDKWQRTRDSVCVNYETATVLCEN